MLVNGRTTLVGGATLLMAASVVNALISLGTTSLIARSIGPELYGRYTFGLTYIMLFLNLATFGLEAVFVRDAAAEKKHLPLIVDILHLRTLIGLVFIVLAIGTAHVLGYSAELVLVIYILSAGLLFQILYESLLAFYKSREQMHVVAVTTVAFRVCTASIIVGSIYSGIGFLGIVAAYSIGNALIFLGLFVWFQRELKWFHLRFRVSQWVALVKRGFPFYTSGLLSVVYARFSVLVLSKTVNELDLGLFMAAQALIESLWFIPSAFQTTFFSAFSRIYGDAPTSLERTYEAVGKYLIIVTAGACVGTILVAQPIIELIFGPQFDGAVLVLDVLIFYWGLVSISQTQASLVYSIRQEILQTKVMILACILTVGLSLLLIPRMGPLGAAIVMVVVEACVVVVLTIILWRAQLRYRMVRVFPGILLSLVGMGIIVEAALRVNVFLGVVLGAAIYGTLLVVLGVINKEERLALTSIVMARRGVKPVDVAAD